MPAVVDILPLHFVIIKGDHVKAFFGSKPGASPPHGTDSAAGDKRGSAELDDKRTGILCLTGIARYIMELKDLT